MGVCIEFIWFRIEREKACTLKPSFEASGSLQGCEFLEELRKYYILMQDPNPPR
jgi:hypothetical protein